MILLRTFPQTICSWWVESEFRKLRKRQPSQLFLYWEIRVPQGNAEVLIKLISLACMAAGKKTYKISSHLPTWRIFATWKMYTFYVFGFMPHCLSLSFCFCFRQSIVLLNRINKRRKHFIGYIIKCYYFSVSNESCWFQIDRRQPITPKWNKTPVLLELDYFSVVSRAIFNFLRIFKFHFSTSEFEKKKQTIWFLMQIT